MKHLFFASLSLSLLAGCASHGNASLPPFAGTDTAAAARARIAFVVALPLRNAAELDRVLAAISDPASPRFRRFLSAPEFAARYAPARANLEAVAMDLRRGGFRVSLSDQAVTAQGSASQVEAYFRTSLQRTAEGELQMSALPRYPGALALRAAAIVGLNGVPPLQTGFQRSSTTFARLPHNYKSARGPYLPTDLKQAYQMPRIQDASGKGVKIDIVMASPVDPTDIKAFFTNVGSAEPALTTIDIDGGGKLGNFATGEATLDVEQSGGIAPGASITIYNIRNLDDTAIYDGYAAAVKGDPAIVNSSFIGCERQFKGKAGLAELASFDALFKEGAARGFTWLASSGDYGADQCGNHTTLGVSWPANSPYVVAVGGTDLITKYTAGSNDSTYVRESAFHDDKPSFGGTYWGSGGGYSTMYTRPSWQDGFVTNSGRGLPDVSLHMGGLGYSGYACRAQKCAPDDSSDLEFQGGEWYLQIGTSASSPNMAGLLALGSEIAKKPLGDVHQLLYGAAKRSGLFHRGVPGNNGFATTSGPWDPVLGLGTPLAAYKLVGATRPAGVPGSSSNP